MTATIDHIATATRHAGLDTTDLDDIAASLDAGELDWYGRGSDVHHLIGQATGPRTSAQSVVDATSHHLGW